MEYSDEDIATAIKNVVGLGNAPIVREFCGFIIMAQSELDYRSKLMHITRGDTKGFYTIKRALRINMS